MAVMVWWVGSGNERTISVADWFSNGIVADSITWNAANGYAVPESIFSSDQLNILESYGDFLRGQDGPRLNRPPSLPGGYSESAFIYYKRVKDLYDAWVAGGGGGGGVTLEQVNDAIAAAVANFVETSDMTTAINAAKNSLINGAPGTRDTLKELSDILTADEGVVSALNSAVLLRALDSGVVHNTGNEPVSGIKTFGAAPVLNTPASLSSHAMRKGEFDAGMSLKADDSAAAHVTGTETIAGAKTFSTVPKSSQDAAGATDLVRKSQTDAIAATAATGVTNAATALAAAGSANTNANTRLLQPTGTPTGSKFLRDDDTWQVPPGGGGGSLVTDQFYIGDGTAYTFVLTHTYGTRDVGVLVEYNDGTGRVVHPDITHPTKDTVAIGFRGTTPPTPNQFQVSLEKRGQTDVTPPTTPTLTAGTITTTTIAVTASGSTDAGGGTLRYVYYLNGVIQNAIPTSSTTFTYTSLTPGTMYTLAVVSVDTAGNPSAPSTNITPSTDAATAITLNVRSGGARVTSGFPTDSFTVGAGSNRRAWAFIYVSTTQDISGALGGGAGFWDTLLLPSTNGSNWDFVDAVTVGSFTSSKLGCCLVFKKDNVATGAHSLTPNIVKSGITINAVALEALVLNGCDLATSITMLKENGNSSAAIGLTLTDPVDSSWGICATVASAVIATGASPAATYSAGSSVTGNGDYALLQDHAVPTGSANDPFTSTPTVVHGSIAFEQKAA